MAQWQPIEVNTRYEVSDDGLVRLCATRHLVGQWENSQGYSLVRLSQPRSVERVHRLVAMAFIPNPKGLPFINHRDSVRNNNVISNLEWCTQRENLAHAAALGRMQRHYWKGKRSPNAKVHDSTATAIRNLYAQGQMSWQQIGEAFGLSKRSVGRIIRRQSYV